MVTVTDLVQGCAKGRAVGAMEERAKVSAEPGAGQISSVARLQCGQFAIFLSHWELESIAVAHFH
jgi:hypothetical protein